MASLTAFEQISDSNLNLPRVRVPKKLLKTVKTVMKRSFQRSFPILITISRSFHILTEFHEKTRQINGDLEGKLVKCCQIAGIDPAQWAGTPG